MEMKGKFKMTHDKSNAQYPETGSKDCRAFVGAFNFYGIVGADQLNLLTIKGLRENLSSWILAVVLCEVVNYLFYIQKGVNIASSSWTNGLQNYADNV